MKKRGREGGREIHDKYSDTCQHKDKFKASISTLHDYSCSEGEIEGERGGRVGSSQRELAGRER